ncbi:hypothetical protein YC2023_072163 [Brassica napus]
MKIYQKIALTIRMKHAKNQIQIRRVGTLLSLPSVPEGVCNVGLLGQTLSMAGLRPMAELTPANFPVTFPVNFLADLALLITSQEWLERLMLAGQMNIRRMSGDWIASVCRLCARAPNYRPTILLNFKEKELMFLGSFGERCELGLTLGNDCVICMFGKRVEQWRLSIVCMSYLELKRGEKVTIGRTEHGSDLPERHHEVAVSHFSERPS